MEIILASASPRRVELIKKIKGITVRVVPSDAKEEADESNPYAYVQTLAYLKAVAVYKKTKSKVIGADTVVVDGAVILGKPENSADAVSMIKSLCGKTHKVLTGVCLIKENGEYVTSVTETAVTFNDYDEQTVDAYVATGSPLDKAGAYGIQDKELAPLVKQVCGDIDNVIGFPVQTVKNMIESFFLTKGEK
ncbi:MAG: septum formation protein Maf [Clostridia bacterium]|nr:septum formation protein Maf [Clostridia bacterium]